MKNNMILIFANTFTSESEMHFIAQIHHIFVLNLLDIFSIYEQEFKTEKYFVFFVNWSLPVEQHGQFWWFVEVLVLDRQRKLVMERVQQSVELEHVQQNVELERQSIMKINDFGYFSLIIFNQLMSI